MSSLKVISVCLPVMLGAYSLPSYAQQLEALTTIDSAEILIGEQVVLQAKIKSPSGMQIQWPVIKDTITKNLEVVSATPIDTMLSKDGKTTILKKDYVLTSFDSGYYVIPPFSFVLENDSNTFAKTDPILLRVNTVAIDTTRDIKDIKPPLDAPFTLDELLPLIYRILAGIAILALVVGGIVYYLKKRKRQPEATIIQKPEKQPHEKALEALYKLKSSHLLRENKLKDYHSIIAETIRLYIEERFHVHALEQTTEEILLQLRSLDISTDAKSKLKQLLSLADLVKFAREKPLPDENEMSIRHAIAFVKMTAPGTEPNENQSKEGHG